MYLELTCEKVLSGNRIVDPFEYNAEITIIYRRIHNSGVLEIDPQYTAVTRAARVGVVAVAAS